LTLDQKTLTQINAQNKQSTSQSVMVGHNSWVLHRVALWRIERCRDSPALLKI